MTPNKSSTSVIKIPVHYSLFLKDTAQFISEYVTLYKENVIS